MLLLAGLESQPQRRSAACVMLTEAKLKTPSLTLGPRCDM